VPASEVAAIHPLDTSLRKEIRDLRAFLDTLGGASPARGESSGAADWPRLPRSS